MRTSILTISALCALAGAAVVVTACQQPLVNCAAAHYPFATYFKRTSGDANSPCGSLQGDILNINTYYQEGGLNGTPNYDDATIAITSTNLAGHIDYAQAWEPPISDPDPKHTRNAIGAFRAGKPVDEFCVVEDFDPAIQEIPALPTIPEKPAVEDDPNTPDIDESMDAVPEVPGEAARSFRLDWSDFRLLVSAAAQGTQFSAHLKYTEDGCVAEYDVFGVSPEVDCQKYDDEGNPLEEGDQDVCDDTANGINPDFATRCESLGPNIGYRCVIKSEPPVYRE